MSERTDEPRSALHRFATPGVILAVGALLVLVYAFPGQMSEDSFAYLRGARGRYFDDHHAPAITALWRHLEFFVAGPTLILLVQLGALLLGCFAILRRIVPERVASWAAAGLVVFPPVLVGVSTISTHALTAALLALGTGALLATGRRIRILGLVALLAASAILPSALIATLPLVVMLYAWRAEVGRRRVAHALLTWAAITAAAAGVNAFYAKQAAPRWHSSLAVLDLAGTLARHDATLGDDQLRPLLAGTGISIELAFHPAVRDLYDPHDLAASRRDLEALWNFPVDGQAPSAAHRDALAAAAWSYATAHPGDYLRHRLAVFAELNWLGARHVDAAVPSRALPDEVLRHGLPTRSSELQDVLSSAVAALARHTPLFTPWLYLVLALVLVPFARAQRDTLALLISGIAMQASLLITATSVAYAQSLWMITSVALAVVLLIWRRACT